MLRKKSHHIFTNTYSGATSFYIVIFATMLFSIIVIGFVTIIMSKSFQTENDKLSQSAYDAALAGVEDSKLAIINCLASDANCAFLSADFNTADCSAVARYLGREFDQMGGAIVSESTDSESTEGLSPEAATEMLQGYTCAIVSNDLKDYRAHISSTDSDSVRVVPLRAAANTSSITGVKISWYASEYSQDGIYTFNNIKNGQVYFGSRDRIPVSTPPVIAVQLIQTDEFFSLESSEIDYSVGDNSDRGTLFLVPSSPSDGGVDHIANSAEMKIMEGYSVSSTTVTSGFVKANDKAKTNTPYLVKCDPSGSEEFVCSVTIELPLPVKSNSNNSENPSRNSTTSFLVISLPYNQPATDFAVELCTDTSSDDDKIAGSCDRTTNFVNAQYAIDSTGHANDIYRRIETRVEVADTYFPFPQYELHLAGNGSVLTKSFWATVGGAYPRGCWYTDNDGVVKICDKNSTSGILSSS